MVLIDSEITVLLALKKMTVIERVEEEERWDREEKVERFCVIYSSRIVLCLL